MQPFSLHIAGQQRNFDTPLLMAIMNLTPDSFAVRHGGLSIDELVCTARQMVVDGADMLDLGAQSTRPGYQRIGVEEEWQRLVPGLRAIRSALPDTLISIDTFYAEVARRALDEGADIINDISAAEDPEMISLVSRARVPYIYTFRAMNTLSALPAEVAELEDLILDPGFGFEKTLEENYSLLRALDRWGAGYPGRPILAGLSRKSMIWRAADCGPDQALSGTIALNMIALQKGSAILRVHDVAEARQTITVYNQLQLCSELNLD